MAKIRIVVVDDHEVVRHGLRLCLDAEPDMVVVGEAARGDDAVEVARRTRPDIMLLDVRLESVEGPDVCRRVLEVSPKTGVVMLTSYLQDGLVLRSLIAGAKGYLIKDVELLQLKQTIRAVYRGNSVLDPKITDHVIATAARTPPDPKRPASRVTALSETDVAILRALSEGCTTKQIAARVHLSPHTVKDHIAKIGDVVGVRSRPRIVADAVRRGLI
jgi:two-component system response regulator DevR